MNCCFFFSSKHWLRQELDPDHPSSFDMIVGFIPDTQPFCFISIGLAKKHFTIFVQHSLVPPPSFPHQTLTRCARCVWLNQSSVLFPGNCVRQSIIPSDLKGESAQQPSHLLTFCRVRSGPGFGWRLLRSGGAGPSHCGDRRLPAGELATPPCC